MKKNIAAIILAAGKGERMKSKNPKVLHQICGRPMIGYVLDLVKDLKISQSTAVLGYKHELVKKSLPQAIKVALQAKLNGTATAVKQALTLLKNFRGTVLIIYGDTPLLTKESLEKLLKYHLESNAAATFLTAKVSKPTGYGRILRDKYSSICAIVEEKDADEFQKDIQEINTGIVCFDKEKLSSVLKQVKPGNKKKEYYLTDTVSLLYKKGLCIESVNLEDPDEALGINSRVELAKANSIMQQRINKKYMQQGVAIVDPATAFIAYGAKIGSDTSIYPFTVIESNVKIGKRCSIGPFTHLRQGCLLKDDVVAGNFLELVRSQVGSKTLIKHFAYIGDATIGRQVNVGAGTVTANFDGSRKNSVLIKDKAFIGSDTVLVAPVEVGKQAKTGAGSVLPKNHDVEDKQVVAGVPAKPLLT